LTLKYTAENFTENFKVDYKLMTELFDFAKSKEIEYDAEGAKISDDLIKRNLKATIARNLFREKVSYQVMNSDDKVVNTALKTLKTMR
jgi:carboxyl-terminal processing protease